MVDDVLLPEDQLRSEQSTNQRYLREISEKAMPVASVSRSRSTEWTGAGRPQVDRPMSFPLAGRVALDAVDEDLGRDFYVGPCRLDKGPLQVVSWAAPMASAFFGEASTQLQGQVVLRRTLIPQGDSIVDLEDDWAGQPLLSHPFSVRAKWNVPRPPERLTTATEPRLQVASVRRPSPVADVPEQRQAPAAETSGGRAPAHATAGLRAAGAVVRALEAPRQSRLSSVLGTLQADQYELVRRPGTVPLIVQGHPGTGKTIVAVHRAAFLSDPESGQAVTSVLLAGPSPEYVRHVRALTEAMSPNGRVTVTSVPEIMRELACLPKIPVGPLDGDGPEDVSSAAGNIAVAVVSALREGASSPLKHSLGNVRRAYNLLRQAGTGTGVRLTAKKRAWVSSLPEWEQARRLPLYLPLLAALGQQLQGSGQRFGHVIIDEAQDVRPLEWMVLMRLVTGQGLTLLGDMNQRRSDHTHRNWQAVVQELDLSDGDVPLEPVLATRGYRSTGAILEFAGRLLPRREQGADCIRSEGVPPTVIKVKESDLSGAVIGEAWTALCRHPKGTVAVVAVTPTSLHPALRRAGWKRSPVFAQEWERGDEVLSVFAAEAARGLEFDVIIVMEPALYPRSAGRSGLLYTSLTRGNKELVVVHARALPAALRRRSGSGRQVRRTRLS